VNQSQEIDCQAWWAGTITLFVVPARQVAKAEGIDSLGSIPGLLKRLQIWAQVRFARHPARGGLIAEIQPRG
jgi:hypothetical protein